MSVYTRALTLVCLFFNKRSYNQAYKRRGGITGWATSSFVLHIVFHECLFANLSCVHEDGDAHYVYRPR